MALSAHDVAAELRRRFGKDPGVVKIHKLLYYAQGWHLVWTGEPLFHERVEAWTNGPVVADLWHDEKRSRPRPSASPLSGVQISTVEYVLERYGRYTAKDLIRRTHDEDPWREASEADASGWGMANPEIDHTALLRWFEKDDEYRELSGEAKRLEVKRAYSLEPLSVTPDIEAAVERAVRGERVRHSRPS
jgi:uncharacterized phage-associated protein